MFVEFAKYVKDEEIEKIESSNELLNYVSQRTILNGMYRAFTIENIQKWNSIVEEAFPGYQGRITVFAYDWLGRVFAINRQTNTVLLFEPGTGEVLDIPVGIEAFHNEEIAEYNEDRLASGFFDEWFENSKYILKPSECVGYKVPLFLNGEDNISNLEVSDMEVYWGIMAQMIP